MKYYNIFLKDIFNIFISMSRDKKICILNFENKKKDLSFQNEKLKRRIYFYSLNSCKSRRIIMKNIVF